MQRHLTATQVARQLSVHPRTVKRWEDRGHIVGFRHPFNGFRLYDPREIERVRTLLMADVLEAGGRGVSEDTSQTRPSGASIGM